MVIHLLGYRDDIVSRKDAADLGVAKDTVFVTLTDTDHGQIAKGLLDPKDQTSMLRKEAVRHALLGEVDQLRRDRPARTERDTHVGRVIYVIHGIRDEGDWAQDVRSAIQLKTASKVSNGSDLRTVVDDKRYGYFPMLPFLYGDRQENVRAFMDEYTENLARYPNAQVIDYGVTATAPT